MPRIRSIKPEFWSDEKLAPMPVATRLLFLALISMADDCGRLIDSVTQIVAFIHPHVEEDTAFASVSRETREGLATLADAGRILRGTTASGQRVIQIVNWTRHQKVDHPNAKAALPEVVTPLPVATPRESLARDSRGIRESLASNSRVDLRSTTYDLRSTTIADVPAAADAASVPGEDVPGDAGWGSRAERLAKANWVTELHIWWTERIGGIDPGALGKFAKPLRGRFSLEEIRAAAEVYFSAEEGPKFKTPKDFFTNFATYHTIAQVPLVDGDGVLTERGRKYGKAS